MTSRRHPVQAIAFASSDSPKLFIAIAETVYAISATTRETVATWKAPPAPIQGKPQLQVPDVADKPEESGDAAEVLPTNEEEEIPATTTTAEENVESTDVVMADSPPSVSSAVGKRKRSPSAASNAPVETLESVETSAEAKKSDKKTRNQKKSEKRKAKNAAKPPTPPQPNYIGQMVPIINRNLLAITTLEDKTLRLHNLDTLEVVKEWVLHKRPSAITLTPNTVLVGDKFGDVFSYKIPSPSELEESSEGKLLLGHVSLLTTLTTAISPPSYQQNGSSGDIKKYIITADRDEHIRITNYPITHVIHGFCLGHTAFVNCLLVTKNNLLVSGGGDDWLGLWDWKAGKLLQRVDMRTHVDAILGHEEAKALTEKLRGYNKKRKRKEEGEPEVEITIAVTQISEVDGREVIVVLEGIPAILWYKHTTDNQLEYAGYIKAAGSVTSLTVQGSRVYFGADSEEGALVSYADLTGGEIIARDFFGGKPFEGQLVEETAADAVNERLYTVEAFRKGFGGFMEDD
ncbi:tRNA (guanine-N(7)-)-methyltransferase non-catalytic subunit trm82 [Orbilia oligospora]|nr:tRNA (guanine-N(7)-)-methyltransferase non-catalytic subunit trm82 [Orbilia oligospora]KAF3249417.1 tRNA (guanine-N(7)-)-methyltransferase non-catalytic subunit trm82 [Orbilia oligospora]KAF3263790.1 tRNA (guanine-N(7)-)-methyltransferase non-catalytic subunit trm82 [Orbilia oligospora]